MSLFSKAKMLAGLLGSMAIGAASAVTQAIRFAPQRASFVPHGGRPRGSRGFAGPVRPAGSKLARLALKGRVTLRR